MIETSYEGEDLRFLFVVSFSAVSASSDRGIVLLCPLCFYFPIIYLFLWSVIMSFKYFSILLNFILFSAVLDCYNLFCNYRISVIFFLMWTKSLFSSLIHSLPRVAYKVAFWMVLVGSINCTIDVYFCLPYKSKIIQRPVICIKDKYKECVFYSSS